MTSESPQFVPKVHPATRAIEEDDPMSLHATPVAGDVEVMFSLIVQEYAWMGWNAEQILSLFRDPFYPALYGLWCLHGEAGTRERIMRVLNRTGVFRFEATVDEPPEAAEPEPDVVQISGLMKLDSAPTPENLESATAARDGLSTREGGRNAQGL